MKRENNNQSVFGHYYRYWSDKGELCYTAVALPIEDFLQGRSISQIEEISAEEFYRGISEECEY